MLKNMDFSQLEKDNPYTAMKRSELATHLAMLQRQCIHFNIPVLIAVEGWESSGKGYVINDLARELDTRAFQVHVFERAGEEEEQRSFTWRFWTRIPAKGDFAIFDRSSYYHMMNDLSLGKSELEQQIAYIRDAEKMLYDDGTIILKFFLNITQKTQKERISDLVSDDNRKFLVTKNDTSQNKHYQKYQEHFSQILNLSHFDFAPWHLLSAENRKDASKYILGTSIRLLQEGVDRHLGKQKTATTFMRAYNRQTCHLHDLDTELRLEETTYEEQSKALQKQAQELADYGAIILKFFLYIDKDEQYKRFLDRQADKPYKLTDEDWRNRNKWDAYILAANEMIDRTSTASAPWILVEGNDKYYARIKVLAEFNQRAKSKLQSL